MKWLEWWVKEWKSGWVIRPRTIRLATGARVECVAAKTDLMIHFWMLTFRLLICWLPFISSCSNILINGLFTRLSCILSPSLSVQLSTSLPLSLSVSVSVPASLLLLLQLCCNSAPFLSFLHLGVSSLVFLPFPVYLPSFHLRLISRLSPLIDRP